MAKSPENPPVEVRLQKCEIAWRSLSAIREAEANPKLHPIEQVERLAASIEKFGFVVPVQVDEDGVLIAGHGRVAAAKRLGLAEVPVQVLRGLDDAQIRALRIVDNRLAEMSEWNRDLLGEELTALRGEHFDLKATGFSDEEFDELLAGDESGAEPPDPDDAASKAVSRPGDVWLCGKHRLACGDPADPATLALAIGDGKRPPPLLLTDLGRSGCDDPAPVFEASGADVAYVWTDPMGGPGLAVALAAAGFQHRTTLIWDKERMGGRGKRYRIEHEVCVYAVRKGGKSRWVGDRKQHSVWNFDGDKPLAPPVDCFAKPLRNNSKRGHAYLDPWLGTGTSLIAGEMSGRICVGVEVRPDRLDAVVRRWQRRTGKDATLEGGKETFAARAKSKRGKGK